MALKNILIIDTNTLARNGMSILIREIYPSVKISYCSDYLGAFALKNRKPHLIVLDINCPKSSPCVLKKIKFLFRSSKILVVTAANVCEVALKANGAEGVIRKSASEQEFQTAVQMAFRERLVSGISL